MVERQQQQTHRGGQHQRDAVGQQDGRRLLDRHDVEHTIGEFAGELADQVLLIGPRKAVRQIADDPHQLPTLDDLDDERLQDAQHARHTQAGEQDEGEHDQRLPIGSPADHVDQRLDRQRRRQREDAADEREQHDHPKITLVEHQQFKEPADRGLVMMVVRPVMRPARMARADGRGGGKRMRFQFILGDQDPRRLVIRQQPPECPARNGSGPHGRIGAAYVRKFDLAADLALQNMKGSVGVAENNGETLGDDVEQLDRLLRG